MHISEVPETFYLQQNKKKYLNKLNQGGAGIARRGQEYLGLPNRASRVLIINEALWNCGTYSQSHNGGTHR